MFKKLLIFFMATLYVLAIDCSSVKSIKAYNGHYYGITTSIYTYDAARKYASDGGGYLAIPNDATENNYLKELAGGGNGAWLGIYDSSFSTNYCFDKSNCTLTPNRFVTVKNQSLSYSNWDTAEPDNYVHSYDVVNSQPMVSPLGEHWAVINGNNGKWNDFGNHMNNINNPAKFKALLEFDTPPSCYTPPTSDAIDTFENKKCNTKIWDNEANLLTPGTTLNCQTDPYGNEYCPDTLSQCAQQFDYADGYSVAGIGTVVDYANKNLVNRYECPYDGYLMARVDHDSCSGCVDLLRHDVKCYTNGNIYLDVYTILKKNGGRYTNIMATTVWASSLNSSQGRIYMGNAGNNCNFPYYYSRSCSGSYCSHMFQLSGSTCNGKDYTKNVGAEVPYVRVLQCPDGYTDTGNGNCSKTLSYTYYDYLCNSNPNAQGFDFTIANSGGNTQKVDTNTTTVDSSLSQNLNSSTPPANNCTRQKFTCQANADRPCSFVDNQWQCSPFPCYGNENIIVKGELEGTNDKNNDGWKEDGTCAGKIYIFNGYDKRCRSSDKFFGLFGGGCCEKEKVFMGLIECKEKEKELAKLNDADLCHEIGEFCSKELKLLVTTICIQETKSHCCFGSKLAKIIHEQGRPQIGLKWGSPESPKCRGFTPEEFQKIDFSKIDLSDAFEIPELDQTKLNNTINNSMANFKNMLGQ